LQINLPGRPERSHTVLANYCPHFADDQPPSRLLFEERRLLQRVEDESHGHRSQEQPEQSRDQLERQGV
jgi:hypothetical protein